MMVVFIPSNDYATSADDAATIDEIDFGYVKADHFESRSFMLGNRSTESVTLSLSISDSSPVTEWTLSHESLTLSAGAVSDSLTLSIALPLDAPNASGSALLIVDDGTDTYSLDLLYEMVGSNLERRSQYPERAGDKTDQFGSVVETFGEPIIIWRFDPVPYDPEDTDILARQSPNARYLNDGGDIIFLRQSNVCDRLNPDNARWGYVRSSQTVRAAFQREDFTINETYEQTNTRVTWTGGAYLTVPAHYEESLTREWALFAEARGADKEQYKRTVLLCQKQGQVFALQNVLAPSYGDELAKFTAELIPVHDTGMGSPDFFNPFALTYTYASDKPYAQYNCPLEVSFAEVVTDSGSAADYSSLPDETPPEDTCPPCPECPEEETPEPEPYVNTYSMTFDGSSNHVGIWQMQDLPIYRTSGYSVSLWVKAPAAISRFVFSESAQGVGIWGMLTHASGAVDVMTWGYVLTTGTLTAFDDTWHHVVWADNNGDAHLYVDGNEDPTDFTYAAASKTLTRTNIGAAKVWTPTEGVINELTDGEIDEVSAWSVVLSQDDVTRLYNSGCPTDLSQDDQNANLIGWWRMGDDAVWNGTAWLIPDASGNGNYATTDRIDEDERVTEIPC